jgi:hypothetical protein
MKKQENTYSKIIIDAIFIYDRSYNYQDKHYLLIEKVLVIIDLSLLIISMLLKLYDGI